MLAAACALAGPATAEAALGDPDPGFGTGGLVVSDLQMTVTDAELGPDGRSAIIGVIPPGAAAAPPAAVVRVSASGAIEGVTPIDLEGSAIGAQIAADPAGGWVVALAHQQGGLVLARLDAAGQVVAGPVQPLNSPVVSVGDVEVLSGGRFLVLGTTSSGQFFVQPYSAALAPDADALVAGSGWDGYALDLDASGRVLAAGTTGSAGVIVRFTAPGDFETFTVDTPGLTLRDVEALADGRILAAGQTPGEGAVVRMSASGVLDTGFGASGSGVILHQRDGHATRFADALVDAVGGIYVAGDADSPTGRDFVLYRFDERGFPDPTFDSSGSRRIGAGGQASALAAGLDAAERPHVLGAAGQFAAAARRLANAPPAAALAGPDALPVGQAGTFDASGSSDPEGALRRFEWDLDGDGAFETEGAMNPTVAHGFPTAGPRVVRVRVTDHRGLQSTAEKPVVAQAQAQPPAAPQAVLGEAFVAAPVSGVIRIRPPGTRKSRRLMAGEQIPEGTLVDARRGRVRIFAAKSARGGTSSALFYRGQFRPTQTRGARPYTTLSLAGGSFRGCGRARPRLRAPIAEAAARRKRRVIRRLWGDGKGRFRTKGRYASATVRGTKWQTIDRCDGVKLQVARGIVDFRDLLRATKARRVRRGGTDFVPSRRRGR